MTTVLGSSSPRRKHILTILCESFTIQAPETDETPLADEPPQQYCERTAHEKALSLSNRVLPDTLLICADTIVTINNTILGKPSSLHHAKTMLRSLSGKTHRVISAVTLLYTDTSSTVQQQTASTTTRVTFKKLTGEEISSYLGCINYTDKAGGYAIQESGDSLISTVSGSVSNVMGLPVGLLFSMLHEMKLLHLFFNLRQ